jgi:hypothetical protein
VLDRFLLMGRRLFGAAMNYPLYRFAHFRESLLRRKLYLDFSGRTEPRFQVTDIVPVCDPCLHPALPELTVL